MLCSDWLIVVENMGGKTWRRAHARHMATQKKVDTTVSVFEMVAQVPKFLHKV